MNGLRGERLDILKPALRGLIEGLARRRPFIDAERAGATLYGAPKFSPLELLDPNETTLSRIIAELLDPSGTHGQGLLFLKAFLAAANLPQPNALDWCRVRREVPVGRHFSTGASERRIDVVIETSGLVVGIENKPWAPQSDHQLADYRAALSRLATGKRTELILLSQKVAETATDEVIHLPFVCNEGASFYSILDGVSAKIKAPAVRDFVTDFCSYLINQFGDAPVLGEADHPFLEAAKEEVFRSNETLKAAAILLLSSSSLHERMLAQVEDRICKDFLPMGLERTTTSSLYDCLSEQYERWGLRRSSWPEHCVLTIESQSGYFGKVLIGIRAPDPALGDQASGELCEQHAALRGVRESVGAGNRSQWWPWFQVATPSDWSVESIARLVLEEAGELADHKEMQRMRTLLRDLTLAIDERFGGAQ